MLRNFHCFLICIFRQFPNCICRFYSGGKISPYSERSGAGRRGTENKPGHGESCVKLKYVLVPTQGLKLADKDDDIQFSLSSVLKWTWYLFLKFTLSLVLRNTKKGVFSLLLQLYSANVTLPNSTTPKSQSPTTCGLFLGKDTRRSQGIKT